MTVPDEAKFSAVVAEHGWHRVGVLCLAVWLHAADSLLAATVMPSAVAEIGGLAFIYWTIALYELGSIVAGFVTGLMSIKLGLRAGMTGAAVVYAVGCVASAAAPDMVVMLVGRTLQGLGGGWLVALAHVAATHLFPERHWPKIIALISAVWGGSALIGPLIGGAFATAGLWRGAFVAFALQAVAFAVLALTLPRDKAGHIQADPLPWRRLALLAGAVLAVLAAGVWPEPWSAAGLLAAGAVLLMLVLRLDGRARSRLLPPAPFSPRTPWGPGFVTVLALSAATISFTVYGPLLMEVLFGATPLVAGLVLALESVSWSLTAILFARAGTQAEPRLIRLGTLLVAFGVVGFVLVMPHGPLVALLPWAILQGAGCGMAWAFIMRRIVASVATEDRERASSAVPAMQMMGYALGAALAGIVANMAGLAEGVDATAAKRAAFWVFAVFLPIAIIGVRAASRLVAPGRSEGQPPGRPRDASDQAVSSGRAPSRRMT